MARFEPLVALFEPLVSRNETRSHTTRERRLRNTIPAIPHSSYTRFARVQLTGTSYCALIAVCGRHNRSDLALKVLRTVPKSLGKGDVVGAWTATIDACGRAGRVGTALTLYGRMLESEVVMVNQYTCNCIFDILVRNEWIDEALDVLDDVKANTDLRIR